MKGCAIFASSSPIAYCLLPVAYCIVGAGYGGRPMTAPTAGDRAADDRPSYCLMPDA